jgi:DHA1 family tetracycline resistance protein-like MFS transporter
MAAARSRSALAVVYFTVFLDLLGFGIVLPALPFFARELGATGLKLGILFSSYSLAQLVGAPILGRLSDRHGRRPVLLTSLAGAAFAFVLTGFSHTLLMLYLARSFAGLCGGSISTAQAYIADVTERSERAKYMGLLGASIGIGFVIGPALGAGLIFLGWGFAGAAFTAAGLTALNFLLALWRLRESRPAEERTRARAPRHWRSTFSRPALRHTLIATFLAMAAFVAMETTFAFLGEDRFELDEGRFGLILVFVGVVMIVVQGGLIGRLTSRYGVRPVSVFGGVLMALALVALPFAPSLAVAIPILGGLAAAQGLVSPTLSTLLSTLSDDDEQGAVLGTGQSLSAAARASAPLAAGALYDLAIPAPYLAAGACALLAALLVGTIRDPAGDPAGEAGDVPDGLAG